MSASTVIWPDRVIALNGQARPAFSPAITDFSLQRATAALRKPAIVQPAPKPIVTIHKVCKTFEGPDEHITALDDVSLSIQPGEIFGIVGRSGAGKSTLVRCINALEKPSAGRIAVDGDDVTQMDRARLIALRRKVGMIFQHSNLLSSRTVYDNVAFPLEIAGVPAHDLHSRVRALLDLVGIFDQRYAYPAQLFGGQKQRVGIARALVHNPRILLCDEATSGLDPETTLAILTLLKRINKELGVTIILVAHEMAVVRDICDRVAVLDGGELAEVGTVADIFSNPSADVTKRLLRVIEPDLPDALGGRIRSVPVAGGDVLLRIRFSGQPSDGSVLADLARRLNLDVRLLQGRIDQISDRLAGNLLIALPATAEMHLVRAVGFLRSRSVKMEVLGYVDGHA